ncbi:YadA C-terminal domain-containing protein [Parvularcula sp. ZS-1/3]|uniref:YadA C-terminal domain-containing protein n=1 Tax=Parvularcula mediterranea TaxID=2732508 RepID=A0A7Y3RL72_9PROT|nr:YadA-like family protein [Parvularcula mediterranea]NNU16139.1 YadA C-terminal domain-containing protein [Parvularcula mediterranea]
MTALSGEVALNQEQILELNDAVAISMAMSGSTWLQQNEKFAVSANWGTFGGSNGMAFSAAGRINKKTSFNAALGVTDRTGQVGARAGVRFGW